MTAWYSKEINPTGKRSLVWDKSKALQPDAPLEIACGQCIGCRLERSRQWAIRCVHEASLWENNCFITLTFDNEHLHQRENPWSLDVADFQKFMKRLRKKYGSGVRFFHCGEYGEKYGRPHYHACLFNFDFHDKELFNIVNGHRLYVSKSLSELWPYGFSTIGDVTFESAAYVARYIMKKVTGDAADERYLYADEDGVAVSIKPEYTTMSRRPGIASGWFDKFGTDVFPTVTKDIDFDSYEGDYVVMNGKKMRPPKFYDRLLERTRPFEHDFIKDARKVNGSKHDENNTPERLAVREEVKRRQIQQLIRPLDGEN